jgi:hypothetical protein
MASAAVRVAARAGRPLVLIVVVTVAVLMVFVVTDRTMVVAFTVVIFVKAEGAVAIEIFEIAVERESRAEESQLVCRAAAERWGGEQGAEREFQFHGEPPVDPAIQPLHHEGSVRGRRALSPRRLFFDRETGFAPGFHAAVECGGVGKAERAQRGGGQGRNLAELADGDDADGGVGEGLVDAKLQLTA